MPFFDTPAQVEEGTKGAEGLYPGPDGFELLELPYKGGELAMVVILPRSASGLPALEKRLGWANLQAWLGKLRQRPVEVFLPKFKLEASFDLNEGLKALGMKRAFRPPTEGDGAQFEGMSKARDPQHKLYVSQVLHKAFVEVAEKGTEAAAATAVLFKEKAEKDRKMVPFTPTFRADRPFAFLIRDRRCGAVLFLGCLLRPKPGA